MPTNGGPSASRVENIDSIESCSRRPESERTDGCADEKVSSSSTSPDRMVRSWAWSPIEGTRERQNGTAGCGTTEGTRERQCGTTGCNHIWALWVRRQARFWVWCSLGAQARPPGSVRAFSYARRVGRGGRRVATKGRRRRRAARRRERRVEAVTTVRGVRVQRRHASWRCRRWHGARRWRAPCTMTTRCPRCAAVGGGGCCSAAGGVGEGVMSVRARRSASGD
jgi:hypothetical protein